MGSQYQDRIIDPSQKKLKAITIAQITIRLIYEKRDVCEKIDWRSVKRSG